MHQLCYFLHIQISVQHHQTNHIFHLNLNKNSLKKKKASPCLQQWLFEHASSWGNLARRRIQQSAHSDYHCHYPHHHDHDHHHHSCFGDVGDKMKKMEWTHLPNRSHRHRHFVDDGFAGIFQVDYPWWYRRFGIWIWSFLIVCPSAAVALSL